MSSGQPITLLHLSDLHFGRHHRFGNLAIGDADADLDTLFRRLDDDLQILKRREHLRPQLIVVSGDLAEWGRPSEFEHAFAFLAKLADRLELPRRNIVVVPGNHDISRDYCESYFSECVAEEREPVKPYPRKWEPFRVQFEAFYKDAPGIAFNARQPWSFWEFDDLKLVVAGLNSTMSESHLDEDHYGSIGDDQARWFADRLQPFVKRRWLRLGVVHHNIVRGAVADDENLRDANNIQQWLGPSLNLLLHGHTHDAKMAWIHQSLPVLSTGSAALKDEARPDQVPNQYQLVRIFDDQIERAVCRYEPAQRRWVGDTRSSRSGRDWLLRNRVEFVDVKGTFGGRSRGAAPADRGDRFRYDDYDDSSRGERSVRRPDFLARVAEICELRFGGERKQVQIEAIRDDPQHQYLHVNVADEGIARSSPVAVAEDGVSTEVIDGFRAAVFEPDYWTLDPNLPCLLVYAGEHASDALIEAAATRNVHLKSFVEFQGIIDFRGYLERQTAQLETGIVYPPELYIPQQIEHELGTERRRSDDAVAELTGWLSQPRACFTLVLGDAGAGKTFLLRQLARRIAKDVPHLTPVLIELRALEKAHSLEQLVAQHLAASGERYIDLKALPYMLREGRIALLFDGFDELAQRVTYQRAAEHFETLLQAAGGNAKVVITSRTQHFESDEQVKTALLERAEQLTGHSLCRILPFDEEQIVEFLERRLENRAAAVERFELIDEIRDLLGLSHNPRMLSFIAGNPAEQLRDARDRKGTITSAELYRLLIERWLTLEYDRVQPRGSAPTLSPEQRWAAVTELALGLWTKLERTITLSELTEQVADAVQRLSTEPAESADRAPYSIATRSPTSSARAPCSCATRRERSRSFTSRSWSGSSPIAPPRSSAAGHGPTRCNDAR